MQRMHKIQMRDQQLPVQMNNNGSWIRVVMVEVEGCDQGRERFGR